MTQALIPHRATIGNSGISSAKPHENAPSIRIMGLTATNCRFPRDSNLQNRNNNFGSGVVEHKKFRLKLFQSRFCDEKRTRSGCNNWGRLWRTSQVLCEAVSSWSVAPPKISDRYITEIGRTIQGKNTRWQATDYAVNRGTRLENLDAVGRSTLTCCALT